MALRVVRVSAEVFGTTASGASQVTRLMAEVAGQTAPDLYLYRLAQQVLLDRGDAPIEESVAHGLVFGQEAHHGGVKIIRVSAEVFGTTAAGEVKLNRLLAEVAGQPDPDLYLYRLAQQVLLDRGVTPIERSVGQSLIFGQAESHTGPIPETVEQSLVFGQSAVGKIGNLQVVRVSAEVFGTTAVGQANVSRVIAEVAGKTEPDLYLYRFAYQALMDRSIKAVKHGLVFGQSVDYIVGGLRVSRTVIDVLGTVDAEVRVSRTVADVLGSPTAPTAQLHRFALQALIAHPVGNELRVSRAVLDTLGTSAAPDLQLHRFALQVLVDVTETPIVPVTGQYSMTKKRTMRQLPRRRN